MKNVETIFYGSEKNGYLIVKMKGEKKLRIFLKNKEIFLEETVVSNIYSSQISNLTFKLAIITNYFYFKNMKMQNIYYSMIASVIFLCLILNDSNQNELKKEINNKISYIDEQLTDEIISNNKLAYLFTYILYFVITLIIILIIRFKFGKFDDNLLKTNVYFLLSMNIIMAGIGGLIALYYRLTNIEAFKYSFLLRNYIILSLVRASYSTCVGILVYYIYNPQLRKSHLPMFIVAMILGYSTKYLPSIFNNTVKDKLDKK